MDILKFYTILWVFCTILTESAFADCDLKSPNDLLESLKANHPQITENQAFLSETSKWIEIAKQRPNPNFDAVGMQGEETDGDVERISLSIKHTFELGGKRPSRIKYADSRRKQFQASIQESNEDIIIDAIIKAYKLRQIKELIPVYEEAYDTLSKILKVKLKRKTRSPNEQVEKETLELATNDYRLKVSKLQSEKIKLSKHLSFFINKKCEFSKSVLPQKVDLNKKFSLSDTHNSSSKLLKAIAKLESAKMKLNLEKSNAYPDLKLGPTFETEKINGRNYQSVGLSLSFDLPILNFNNGRKSQALAQISTAKLKLKNVEKKASVDLEIWIDKYNSLRERLKNSSTKDDLEIKHLKIEKLFKRGIISTAMVIESHRQLIGFAKTRYDFELDTVEALWNIYKINGTLFSEKL